MKRFLSRLWKFRSLTWPQRRVFLQALFWLPATRLLLNTIGYRRCLKLLRRLSRKAPARPGPTADPTDYGRQVAALVNIAALRGVHRANCLPRSLVLYYLLRRQGIEAELRIGVQRESDIFAAHAWIELQGVPLNDRADVGDRFAALS